MSYEELIQELDAESTATTKNNDNGNKIKTFEDACKKLGIMKIPSFINSLGDTESCLQANALYKLLIIQKAINNGKWRDEEGWSYYPYWMTYSKEETECMSEEEKQRYGIKQILSCADVTECLGVRCVGAFRRGVGTDTNYGFPLCFNSKEAALYAANKFEDLFFQYYGIKVKE
jgi:hypothetical protein